jgi:biopolymer transport protein ExbB/TolQ
MNPVVKWPLISGIILFIAGPTIGIVGTILGMITAFRSHSSSGTVDSEPLAAGISSSLMTTAIGIPVGLLGLALLLFSLFAFLITRNYPPKEKI